MDKSIWGMLNDTEQALLREVEPEALAALDEDALVELHTRVRRARNKYSKLYRRRAREQVSGDASRARANKVHHRTLVKAEAFEEALSDVSRQLGRVARATAAELRAERIAAAKSSGKGSAKKASKSAAKKPAKGSASKKSAAKKKQRTPVAKRASASAKASTKRKQAKRDAR